jgi:uncharacterized protein (TIGR02246 family)
VIPSSGSEHAGSREGRPIEDEVMTPANLRTEIEEADRAFESNFDRHDADGMGDLYTEDGQLLPPGSGVVSGRDDIAAFWQGVFDTGVASARLETVEVEDHGDTAVETGRFTLSDADERTVDHGTFLVVWKNDGEEWKLHRDIWNSNTPEEG